MPKYTIEIREGGEMRVVVEAASEEAARELAEEKYNNGDFSIPFGKGWVDFDVIGEAEVDSFITDKLT